VSLFKCPAKLTRLLIKVQKFESFDRRRLEINVNLNEASDREGRTQGGGLVGGWKNWKFSKSRFCWCGQKRSTALPCMQSYGLFHFRFWELRCLRIILFSVSSSDIFARFYFLFFNCRFWCACVKDDLYLCIRRCQHFDFLYSICIRFRLWPGPGSFLLWVSVRVRLLTRTPT